MRPAAWLLASCLLGGQEAPAPLFPSALGADPMARIQLCPPGCWDGLLLGTTVPQVRRPPRPTAGATVEVWDLALRESPREEAFSLTRGDLKRRLTRALAVPPPSHGTLELSDLMLSDVSNPQRLDLQKVKSMQERFNRLPPNGSPVRQ